jgi:DNA-binding MarR family transcriptional regulator
MTTPDVEPLMALLERLPSPGRLRALSAIASAPDGLGAVGIVAAGDVPTLGMAAYHVRKLAADGLIERVRTEPRRGATASFYVITPAGRRLLGLVETASAALGQHAIEFGPPLETVR